MPPTFWAFVVVGLSMWVCAACYFAMSSCGDFAPRNCGLRTARGRGDGFVIVCAKNFPPVGGNMSLYEKKFAGVQICLYLCTCFSMLKIMKVKVSREEMDRILSDPEECLKAGVSAKDPWWVIALKVISYLIGLVLAGVASASCARTLLVI